jgi:hypothetical protein
LACAAVLAPAVAAAQPTPKFTYASADDVAAAEKAKDKPKWEASAQAGLILTTGNSRVTTFATGLTASRKAKKNKLSFEAGAAYAKSSIFLGVDDNGNGMLSPDEIDRPSSVTTRSWMLKGRYDRFLTKKNALFISAGVAADKPAGKELVGNGQVGYSRELYHHDVHTFTGEGGYDLTYEDQVSADGFAIHSLRGFASYKGALSDDTSVDASVEGLFNMNSLETGTGHVDSFDDRRWTGKLALSTKLSTKLAFRFSFEAKHDSAPAPRAPFAIPYETGFVPVADKLDTKAEATLIVTLL